MRLRLDVAADLAEEDVVRIEFADLERLMAVADTARADDELGPEFFHRVGKLGKWASI